MSLCRYNTSKPCENHGTSGRTCIDCILGEIKAELQDTGAYEQETNGKTEFLKGITYCLGIIDKYVAESNDIEKRKPCINYEDGCEEWAGCPCVHYKAEGEEV